MTVMGMRQSPEAALEALIGWAKIRYSLELDADEVRKSGPAKMKTMLEDGIRKWFEDKQLDKALAEVSELPTVEKVDELLRSKYDGQVPDWLSWLDEDEFHAASRGLIEARLRPEMLQLEMTIMLDTLDQAWKDHLYAMDQLRDGINYQAFAQQDPKIAYKKQGSELFSEMLDGVQERVAEYIFKARLNPAASMPPQNAPPQQAGGRAQGGFFGSSISGPGFASSNAPTGKGPAGDPTKAGQA